MPMQTPPCPPILHRFLAVFRCFWFWWWMVGLSMLGPLSIFAACDMANSACRRERAADVASARARSAGSVQHR